MWRAIISLCGAVLTIGLGGGVHDFMVRSASHQRDHADTCSIERIGRAAAADTSRLRRVKLEFAPGASSEGGETIVYFDGAQPRVIVITYFGETGRAVIRYYLAAPDQYLVEREELRYTASIGTRSRPVATVRIPSTIYVCGSVSENPLTSNNVAHIRSDLDSTMARLHRPR